MPGVSSSIRLALPTALVMRELADRAWPALLDHICDRRLIEPAFQPIVDLARGVVCGYEGLARIASLDDDCGPQEWFQAAAWHGYAARLEATALGAVLAHRRELPANCFLSMNVSPGALLADETRTLLSDQPDLAGVVIEITEQTPVEDYDELTGVLGGLRERGAMIAVDDTGAGYASLRHLIALQPQFVKVDRALVEGIDRDPHRAAAVAAIGALAGELDAWLVAEGVERSQELERLVELDVPLAQGYLLGRPDGAMTQIPRQLARVLRDRQRLKTGDRLGGLARPVPAVHADPVVVAETTVLVDERNRPRYVFVPGGGRRFDRYPAMCAQRQDDVRDVALRAAARPSGDRYGPLCLCDERGGLIGIIAVESLLESLARRRDRTPIT